MRSTLTVATSLTTVVSLAVVLLFSTTASAATVAFKCTSEDGRISFLDKKPTADQHCAKIEEVRINVGKSSSATAMDDPKAEGDTANTATEGAAFEKEVAKRKAEIKKGCEARRSNLKKLKNNNQITMKGKDGESRVLSAEEHQKKISDLQKQINDFCS